LPKTVVIISRSKEPKMSDTIPPPTPSPVSTIQSSPVPKINPLFQTSLRPAALGKTGHENDYSWITGELQKSGNAWVLRYANAGEKDKFGGALILQTSIDMRTFRDGDLVSVRGTVMLSNRGVTGPVYHALSMQLIERPTR
jgi:hypothetical protein